MAELSRDEHIRSLVDEHPDRPPPRIDPGILVQAGEGSGCASFGTRSAGHTRVGAMLSGPKMATRH
jgi:hypothetical protein